nr:hypothetical protein [Pseudoxanthomonas sp.]
MNLHRHNPAPDSGPPARDPPSPSNTGNVDTHHERLVALVRALCPDAPPVDAGCAQRMAALLEDASWACEPAIRHGLAAVLDRVLDTGDAGMPLPLDVSWPGLARELEAYGDFLRLRALESSLRHAPVGGFPFDRHDWEHARDQESALREHQRHVREASYTPSPSEVFRIH